MMSQIWNDMYTTSAAIHNVWNEWKPYCDWTVEVWRNSFDESIFCRFFWDGTFCNHQIMTKSRFAKCKIQTKNVYGSVSCCHKFQVALANQVWTKHRVDILWCAVLPIVAAQDLLQWLLQYVHLHLALAYRPSPKRRPVGRVETVQMCLVQELFGQHRKSLE